MFPISMFPEWIRVFSYIMPVTYSLDALRLSIIKGYSISMLSDQLIILFCVGLVLLPLSLKFFEWAVEKGKRTGKLMQY